MADALVSFVVEELGSIVTDEVILLASVKKELKSLSSTFSSIQALLEDAERKQVTMKGVRVWLGKIKEVAYEVEDILDEWRTDDIDKIQMVRSCSLFPCLCFKQLKSHHDIGHKIREVKGKLNEISKDKDNFNLVVNVGEGMSRLNKEERQTTSLVDKSEIFGRDDFKKSIIEQLVSETGQEEKSVSVISIVGMGGLGKTTLAQLIYNDDRVMAHFEKRIWVCVSEHSDVKSIAIKVIESMGGRGSPSNNPDLDTLVCNLRKASEKMQFLLVLDDVWDESGRLWEELKVPLMGAALGSKVLVTTRSRKAAGAMGTLCINVRELGILSDADCWEVFNSRALKGTEEENCQELMKIGEKIVERCNGVPLAARAVGSLLHGTRDKRYWEHVLDSEIWEWANDDIHKNGIWEWANDDIHKNGILPALLLSYYNLPSHLKRCFSFCAMFPKNHVIEKDELVKLWMAHGIIRCEEANKDVTKTETFGEWHFDYLLTCSLFQDAERDRYGNIVRCKMHDLVHDLATFVSSGDYCKMEAESSKLSSNKCHHVSLLVNDCVSSIPSLLRRVERLHTLLLFGSSAIMAVPDNLFNSLRCLRALDLSGTSIENLPSFIGKLKHLRYLSLCGSKIKELPEFVTGLCNLQTLKLNRCRYLHSLPSGMSKMVKLRHLEIEKTDDLTVLPNGLGKLTSLRTLSKFPLGDENGGCKIGELKDLNLKGELSIENLERVVNDASEAELHKKSDLHVLSLCCNDKSDEEWKTLVDDEMKRMDRVLEGFRPPHLNLKELKIKNYAGSMFPSWLEDSRFCSLVEVVLENCRKCMLLPGLGKLPSLKCLKIIGADEVKVVGCEFYGTVDAGTKETRFPKLDELHFESMLNWEDWKLKAMPSLKKLEISKCKKLKAMPSDGWGLLESLHTLTISSCPKLASLPEGLGQLKALQTLEIWHCGGLSSLPEGLGQLRALQTLQIWECGGLSSLPEGLGQLKALQTLEIRDCGGLSSLPEGLGQLRALQTLQIWKCGGLSSLPEGLGQLRALQTLEIWECGGLSSLPEGLGQLKALQTLDIWECGGLSSLPEGIGQLKALQTLQIQDCGGLSSLPEGLGQLKSLCRLNIWDCPQLRPLPNLQRLTALKSLSIKRCPLLTQRLDKEKGEDWYKISHIPRIWIDDNEDKGLVME